MASPSASSARSSRTPRIVTAPGTRPSETRTAGSWSGRSALRSNPPILRTRGRSSWSAKNDGSPTLLDVCGHLDIAGVVHGDHGSDRPDRLAELARPVLERWRTRARADACTRLRDAKGQGRAVTTVAAVLVAVAEGRGRELIVEEGLSMPRTWLDGLSPGEGPDPSIDTEDVVDDLIEQVLSAGGVVTFVDRGSLDDCGQIGLLLRW